MSVRILQLVLNISTDNRKDTKPNWKSDGDRDRMNDLYKDYYSVPR